MVGMIAWVKPIEGSERPNNQRARIEAIAVGHAIVTFMGDDKVEMIPLDAICGLEIDEECTLYFRDCQVTGQWSKKLE